MCFVCGRDEHSSGKAHIPGHKGERPGELRTLRRWEAEASASLQRSGLGLEARKHLLSPLCFPRASSSPALP